MVHIPIISDIYNLFTGSKPTEQPPQAEPGQPPNVEATVSPTDATVTKEVPHAPHRQIPKPPPAKASLDHHMVHFVKHSEASLTNQMEGLYQKIEGRTGKIELADKLIRQMRQARNDKDMSCDLSANAEAKANMKALKDAGFEIDLNVTKFTREKCDDCIKSLENFSQSEHHHINFDRIKIEKLLNHLNHAYKVAASHEKNSHNTKRTISGNMAGR